MTSANARIPVIQAVMAEYRKQTFCFGRCYDRIHMESTRNDYRFMRGYGLSEFLIPDPD